VPGLYACHNMPGGIKITDMDILRENPTLPAKTAHNIILTFPLPVAGRAGDRHLVRRPAVPQTQRARHLAGLEIGRKMHPPVNKLGIFSRNAALPSHRNALLSTASLHG
jgi:hypothetical protein